MPSDTAFAPTRRPSAEPTATEPQREADDIRAEIIAYLQGSYGRGTLVLAGNHDVDAVNWLVCHDVTEIVSSPSPPVTWSVVSNFLYKTIAGGSAAIAGVGLASAMAGMPGISVAGLGAVAGGVASAAAMSGVGLAAWRAALLERLIERDALTADVITLSLSDRASMSTIGNLRTTTIIDATPAYDDDF